MSDNLAGMLIDCPPFSIYSTYAGLSPRAISLSSPVVLFQIEFGLQVSDIRMADEGQVDCQCRMDGGGRGKAGELSVGREAEEGEHLLGEL